MNCLRKLYTLIEDNNFPGCSKIFLKLVYKKKGTLKHDPNLLKTGSDSGPLLQLGLIEQDEHNRVFLTDAAREMIN